MCLAIPAQVKGVDETTRMGTVDIMGVTREVALDLVPNVAVGDFVLVHAGYGIQIIDEEAAQETLDLIREFPELVSDEHPGMGTGGA